MSLPDLGNGGPFYSLTEDDPRARAREEVHLNFGSDRVIFAGIVGVSILLFVLWKTSRPK